MRPTREDIIEDPCEYMAQLAQRILPLEKWGFEESFRGGIRLIYNSKRCRLKIYYEGWDLLVGHSIDIQYGRLHAPNEAMTMQWRGEECICWHDPEPVLRFLDFLDGQPLPEKIPLVWRYTHPVEEQYRQSELGKSLAGKRRQPEWRMHMEAAIWERYAPRLFEVFDLRRPELWEQYRAFLRACYVREGKNEAEEERKGRIPYYRVC